MYRPKTKNHEQLFAFQGLHWVVKGITNVPM